MRNSDAGGGVGGAMRKPDRTLIADMEVFQGAGPEMLDAILADARVLRIERETAVFAEGEEAAAFFLLLDGHVRVVRTTPAGDQVIMRYIGAGQLIGIAQAIGQATYPASAIAAVDCVALAWPGSLWERFIARTPGFAAAACRTVGRRLQDTQAQLIDMATGQVEQRVARALCRLARQSGRQTGAGLEISFPLSRQDIAEMTGATLHSVSRLLAAWTAMGIIAGGRQRVTVTDFARLQARAGNHPPDASTGGGHGP